MAAWNDDVNDVPLNPAALLPCGLMPGRIRTRQSGLNGEAVGDQSQGRAAHDGRMLASDGAGDYDWRRWRNSSEVGEKHLPDLDCRATRIV